MAFGRLERRSGPQPMSEINMTPLIDVMLVLLVIFMISAPLITSGLKLELPRSEAAAPTDAPVFIELTLTPDGRLLQDRQPVERVALAVQLAETARRKPETEVHLRADRAVPYGQVAELIGLVQQAGLHRIAFVADPTPVIDPAGPAASR